MPIERPDRPQATVSKLPSHAMTYVLLSFWSLVVYLLLTAGSGSALGLWSEPEFIAGIIVALFSGALLTRSVGLRVRVASLSPLRWGIALCYFAGPFFLEMARANWDVAMRVLSGRIRPGIVRVRSGQKTDLGTMLTANSITLTPGTLTVDVDPETNDLYVHVIHLSDAEAQKEAFKPREIFSLFNCPAWIRRIAE